METHEERIHEVLRRWWGFDSFRPVQEQIVRAAMEGRDTLALMPTGGGKSLTYQVPTMAREGLCIVVTPLISCVFAYPSHIFNMILRRKLLLVISLTNFFGSLCFFFGLPLAGR